jgi:hypothetical protein
MKVKVTNVISFKKNELETANIIDLQFIEGNKVLPKDIFICEENNQLIFEVKHLIIGGADLKKRIFPVAIENSNVQDFLNKIFIKKE